MKTKLDHIYGVTGTGDINALKEKVENIDTRLTSLSNVAAKTNVDNNFSTNQTVRGTIKSTDNVRVEKGDKKIVMENFDYGGKNLSRIAFQVGTSNRLLIQHNNNDNLTQFIGSEINMSVPDPTGNKHPANKQWVEAQITNAFTTTELITWSGNMNSTNLTWDKSGQFRETGTYAFTVRVKANDKTNYITETINIDNLTKTYISSVKLMDYGKDVSSAVQTLPQNALALVYANKNIKLVKYGTTHPNNAEIKIFFKKVI